MSSAQQRLSPLLGQSYREHDYSPAFHNMVHKVVSKIYHKRGRRKPILASSALHSLIEDEKEQTCTLNSFLFNTARKNSPRAQNFLTTPRSSKDTLFKRQEEKPREVVPSFQKRFLRTQYNTRNQRCETQPHSSYNLKLYQKINEYNQCLVTKTFRFQQKHKPPLDLQSEPVQEQQQPFVSPVLRRRMHNFTTRESKFSVKTIQQGPRSASLPITFKNEFKPWETKDVDQFVF